jgi:two-component system, cell cycle sensor histidine kinase and response regulator CckA
MKSDALFTLENAVWPAMLIEQAGTIRRANAPAINLFGPVVEGETALLGSIWAQENECPAQQFLTRADLPLSGMIPVKFRVKGGITVEFSTAVCPVSREGQKYFLFQIFPAAPAGSPEKTAPKIEAATPPLEAAPAPVEANLAHKQKLDCALQLARTVSLDFNNALTSILGHTSLLLSKAEMTHPWRKSLVEIEKSAAKASEVTNDLAAFSIQEKDDPAQRAGNLNMVLQRAVDLFRAPELARIKFPLQLERQLFSVKFDEAKVQQALVKILENAVQAISGEGQISIQTRNLELTEPTQDRMARLVPGNYVVIEISDNGEGIEPEVLPRIFEPFFTTKNPTRHRGLGLAWVYGIVTNHGGAVAVSSRPGGGTSVRLYLPADKKILRTTLMEPDDLSGTQTLLIVDDEDLLLTMGQMVLSSFGYEVLTANSGQKALEIFKAGKKIDLVLSDLVMPNMSGRELIEHIRKLAPETRIICTSGFVRNSQMQDSETYLQKPFTSQDLLRKVKQVLSSE